MANNAPSSNGTRTLIADKDLPGGASVTQDPLEKTFRKRTLVLLLPAVTTMYGLYQGLQQVLLPAQVEAMDAANKVDNLAMLAVVSSVAGTIALVMGGAVSDRTRSRFGRRTPWLLGSAIVSTGLAVAMGWASTIIYGLL